MNGVECAVPGPRMPAAARVALYLLLQVGAVAVIQISFALFVVLRAVLAGQSLQELLSGMASQPERILGWTGLAAMEWLSVIATLAITWLVVQIADRKPLPAIGFTEPRLLPIHAAVGLILGGLLLGTVLLAGIAAGWFQVSPAASVAKSAAVIAGALLVFVPAAAVEEISMRGYVLRVLDERYGWRWALTISSLLFAAMHAGNPGFRSSPAPAIGLLVAGVYLGAAYLLTRRLYLPIALHTAWNLFEGPIFGFRVSGIATPSVVRTAAAGPALWTGGAFGPEAGLLLAVAVVIHLPLLIAVGRRLAARASAAAR